MRLILIAMAVATVLPMPAARAADVDSAFMTLDAEDVTRRGRRPGPLVAEAAVAGRFGTLNLQTCQDYLYLSGI